jgi:hypothetical protein
MRDYLGDGFRIRVPAYLRVGRHGYLNASEVPRPGREISGIAFELISNEHAEAVRFAMFTAKMSYSWADVDGRILRRCAMLSRPGGDELLSTTHNTITSQDLHRYEAVFPLDSDVQGNIAVHGGGDIAVFDRLCQEILVSLGLVS